VILTTVLVFLSPEARCRASQVSLKSDFKVLYEVTKMPTEEGPDHVFVARTFHNRIAAYIRRFAEEYREYFSTSFLIGDSGKPIRYTVPYVGLLTYVELILVFLGIFFASKRKELLVIIALLVISPLPAAITIEDTPNIQRAILMIPFLLIIAAWGFYGLNKLTSKWRYISILIGVCYFLNFIYFLHMYFIHQKMSIATYYRDGGNVELVKKLSEIGGNYKKIILTNSPDNLYPWIDFLGKVENFKNIVFSPDKCPLENALERGDKDFDSVLFVEAEGCEINKKFESKIKLIETIHRPDGSPPYYLRIVTLN
jgi:hypothetical protein